MRANHARLDQLRRTYADVSDKDFYAAWMAKAIDGFDTAVAHVQATFGPREHEADLRSHEQIEAEDGPSLVVSGGRQRARR